MNRILGALAGSVLLAACGGSDPGSGTQTLYVTATAQSDGSSNGTSLLVVVRDGGSNGAFVDTATVTMIGDRGTSYTLPFVGIFGLGGYYKNAINWEGGWRLRIASGSDNLEAYVAGPGLTTITAPTASTTFAKASAQNLVVQWRDEMGRRMPNAEVRLRRADLQRTTDDTGSYSVDFNALVPATDERITLTRWTELSLRGGVTGSTFRAQTTAEVTFAVE